MNLTRTPLLLERARPSIGVVPKSRTRRISNLRKLGPTRRDLSARLERRVRDRATPQSREVMRSSSRSRAQRRKSERPMSAGQRRSRTMLGLQNLRSRLLRDSNT